MRRPLRIPLRPELLVAWLVLLSGVAAAEAGLRRPSPHVTLRPPERASGVVEDLRAVPLTEIPDDASAAVASGVVFGRTEHVTPADEAAFLDSGLWHLLAASGQNVALVAGCCVLAARLLGRTRVAGAVAALLAIPAYAVVVGGGASIARATLVGELALVAWLAGRLPDARQLLVVAAAAICWAWPGAHRGLGMQLSFACAAGLVIWAAPATRTLVARGVPRWLAAGTAATAICSTVTAPILVVRTGSAPLAASVANLAAVPIAAATLVTGLVSTLAMLLLEPVGAELPAQVGMRACGALAGVLRRIARRAARIPGAQTSSCAIAIGGPAFALLWSMLPNAAARLGGRIRRYRLLLALTALGALGTQLVHGVVPGASLLASWVAPGSVQPASPDALRIAVLDVGQGDATLLSSGDRSVLVDTGPPGGRLMQRLRELGIDRLDGIVLTHDSSDHRGEAEAAMAALRPRWVAMPRAAPGSWRRVREAAPRVVELCAGDSVDVGRARLHVMHPRCDGTIAPRTGDVHNDGSMVLLVHHGSVRALLAADAESPVLSPLALPPVELLRVAHHGSSDEALPHLLARIRPQVSAISVGADNDYGHPTRQVLRDLRAMGSLVLRTDEDGTIVLDSDGRRLVRVR